jgi:excisionase family DNA binding protein
MLRHDGAWKQCTTNNKNVDINGKYDNNDKYRISTETVMTQVESQSDTLTTRETAKILKASVRTIQLWVEDGRLKAWKTPGGHRRVLRASVDEMLLNRRRVSGGGGYKYEALLVSDDPLDLAMLEKTLGNLGPNVHVRVSQDAYAALIRIGEVCPDLLVIDLEMSGLDAVRYLNTLMAEEARRPARIIALSMVGSEALMLRPGFPDGVMALRKPLRSAALLSLGKACYAAWHDAHY